MTAAQTIPNTAAVAATEAKPISVCLLISSLEFGGAERQVVEMVRSFDPKVVRRDLWRLAQWERQRMRRRAATT